MSLRTLVLLPLVGLSLAGCSTNNDADYSVRDDNGNVVATAKDVPAGTTIEQCVDPAGEFMGEAYCPDPDGDNAYAVNSEDPFNGTAPTCLCLSAGDPGAGWDIVTSTAEIATFDCAPADPEVGSASVTAYVDSDDDGLGTGSSMMVCGTGTGTGYSTVAGDCNDADPLVGAAATWFHDWDNDGYGDAAMSNESCEPPVGYVGNSDDCYDGDSTTSPGQGALEALEGCYRDVDGDGYGDADPPEGVPADFGGDCNDGDATTHPGAAETCNELDDDCDSIVDEEAIDVSIWYSDGDSDGYGDPALPIVICGEAPVGFVGNSDDCNVVDGTVYPGAAETCNELDDDCDTVADEGDVCVDPDPDADGDGHPASTDCNDGNSSVNPGMSEVTGNGIDDDCNAATSDVAADPDADGDGHPASTDCNDGNSSVNPGMSEVPFNGIDDNCDGMAATSAMATIEVTPTASQMGVSWELWVRDGTVDPSGSSTTTWASGGAASGTGALTATVTLVDGNVEMINGPFNGGTYWGFMIGTENLETTFTVNGYSFTMTNTCWDGTYACTSGGTDGWWTVDTL